MKIVKFGVGGIFAKQKKERARGKREEIGGGRDERPWRKYWKREKVKRRS